MLKYSVHYSDVEDVFMPPADDFHGIPKWMAEIQTEEGLLGTFNLTGAKLKSIVSQGRTDVIAALARHAIGHHTMRGSIHPTMMDYLDDAGWEDGIQAVARNEAPLFPLVRRVFGKDITHFHQHHTNVAPQAYVAFLRCRTPVSSMLGDVLQFYPDHGVSWYCNNLSFTLRGSGCPGQYHRPDWPARFAEWVSEGLERPLGNRDFFPTFGAHPMELKSMVYTDRFYAANGRNLAPRDYGLWGTPPLRSEKEIARTKRNYRQAVRTLARIKGIEVTDYRSLAHIYGYQKRLVSRADLEPFCDQLVRTWTLTIGRYFSAAELLVALAEHALTYEKTGALPASVRRQPVLGPLEIPVSWPEIPELTWRATLALARRLLAHVGKTGHLPGRLGDRRRLIGPSHLLGALAAGYLNVLAGGKTPTVKLWEPGRGSEERFLEPWPQGTEMRWTPNKLTSPDLKGYNFWKYSRLMNWTLKPADRLAHFQKEAIEVEDNPFVVSSRVARRPAAPRGFRESGRARKKE